MEKQDSVSPPETKSRPMFPPDGPELRSKSSVTTLKSNIPPSTASAAPMGNSLSSTGTIPFTPSKRANTEKPIAFPSTSARKSPMEPVSWKSGKSNSGPFRTRNKSDLPCQIHKTISGKRTSGDGFSFFEHAFSVNKLLSADSRPRNAKSPPERSRRSHTATPEISEA